MRDGLIVSYGLSHFKFGPNLSLVYPMSAYVHRFNLHTKYGCTYEFYCALGSCTMINVLHLHVQCTCTCMTMCLKAIEPASIVVKGVPCLC